MGKKRHFNDQVVWVTGASGGIGEAIARALVDQGARVILSARRQAELLRVQAACGGPSRAAVLPLDLAALDELPSRVSDAIACFGRVDTVVHNSGLSQRSLVKDTQLSVYQRLMQVNYFGPVAITSAILPHMLARRSGQFVVITSVVGLIGSQLRSGYAASKHALHGFFDSMRAEVGRDGISVTLVCPGYVRTNISLNAVRGDDSTHAVMDERTAQGISPERCAEEVLDAAAAKLPEAYVGGRETWGIYLKRMSPRLFARLVERAKVV